MGGSKDYKVPEIPGKPTRPPKVEYGSIRELYLQVDEIFLADTKSLIVSPCGRRIYCFEHHFFHMAGVVVAGVDELSMPHERGTILTTPEGFAH